MRLPHVFLFAFVFAFVFVLTTCGQASKQAGPAIVNCAGANRAEIEKLLTTWSTMPADDWATITGQAVAVGVTIGGCAFAELVLRRKLPGDIMARSTAPELNEGRAAFEDFRSRHAAGATFRTIRGDL